MKDYYEFHEFAEVGERFCIIFGNRLGKFINNHVSALVNGRPTIDIIKFDEWLHSKHGAYEEQGLSMKTCIEKYYGKEGTEIVEKLL